MLSSRCDHSCKSPALSAPRLRAICYSRLQAHAIRLPKQKEQLVAVRPQLSLSRPQRQGVGTVLETSQLQKRREQSRLQSGQQQPDRAWQRVLVVVEGLSDLRAVQRSVPAQAFVLHGASKVTLPATQEKLLKLAVQAEQVIALLDPDVAGRQSRTILDSLLCGQLFHAFVPGLHATASNDIRPIALVNGHTFMNYLALWSLKPFIHSQEELWKLQRTSCPTLERLSWRPQRPHLFCYSGHSYLLKSPRTCNRQKKAGNIGVEHATPEQIRQALLTARRSTVGRTEFDRTDLFEWGLSVDMGTPSYLSKGCVQRRAAVCFALGLGNCDGKQLLKQLNNYNFHRQDIVRTLESIQTPHRM